MRIFSVLKALPLLFCGLLSVSCVTQQQVQLDYYAPAEGSPIPLGSKISVSAESEGRAAKLLQKELLTALSRSGHFRTVAPYSGEPLRLQISDVKIRCYNVGDTEDPLHLSRKALNVYHEGRARRVHTRSSYTELHAVVSAVSGGQVLWRKSHSVTVSTPPRTRPGLAEPCRRLVEELAPQLMPQLKQYSVKVKTRGAAPQLRQAVQACRYKDWPRALELARQAHRQNPQDPEPIYFIGLMARQQGDYPASTALFKKAHALHPDPRYAEAQEQNLHLYRQEAAAHSKKL